MVAAVLLALIVGTIVSIMINLPLLLAIAKTDGLTDEFFWLAVVAAWWIASSISAVITYAIAYILIKKCGFGKIKWLNILCATLTLLWCLFWSIVSFCSLPLIHYNDDYDDSYYEDADDGYYEEISEDM